MKRMILVIALSLLISPVFTQKASAAAICNDGTYSSSSGSGTCSHHGGVRTWL